VYIIDILFTTGGERDDGERREEMMRGENKREMRKKNRNKRVISYTFLSSTAQRSHFAK